MQEVTFQRDDLNLAGLLFQSKNFTESEKYTYCVTALDRIQNESKIAKKKVKL